MRAKKSANTPSDRKLRDRNEIEAAIRIVAGREMNDVKGRNDFLERA